MSYRFVSRLVVPALLATTAVVGACTDRLLQPTVRANPHRVSASQPGGDCGADCLVTDGLAPLRAAQPVPDSVGGSLGLASGEITGVAGDSVALRLEASPAVLASLGADELLLVRAGATSASYTLTSLVAGIAVYRFTANSTVHISYRLSRNVSGSIPDGLFRIHQFTSSQQSARLFRPWVTGALNASGLSGTNCPILFASGVVCGATVNVSPFSAPPQNIGGTFTSQSGTGASSTITITFSLSVDTVNATVYDPTFSGNMMVAYDSTGAQIGSVSFAFTGMPGDNVPDLETIIAHGIRRIDLIPAAADYVSYDVSFSIPECPSTGDTVLNTKGVRDSLTAAFNRSNPNAPPGTGARMEHEGVVWQMPDGSFLAVDYPGLTVGTECGAIFSSQPSPPVSGAVKVAEFHTHPSSGNEPLYACPNLPAMPGVPKPPYHAQFAGDSGIVDNPVGDANGGGSPQDWMNAFLHNTTEYIVNKDGSVWRLDPNTLIFDRAKNPNQWHWQNPSVPGCFTR